uniref:glutamate--cysteine ligase catalytic subunit-like isoform X2 n=1 Tax=Ciona intestinalis TaxID=7719 RepID=UPI000EF4F6AD|nr:glutamate--cysteine ligase catalytic subunit-like isoform X2 [Ciona intestinalis]|eukprot:XP_026696290.1 glutamate--cysteine ligase catalytic subunit-like isoform X2 [Ciona intestinalis]
MGFLEYEGEPLPFNEIRPHIEHVKSHGILQFLNIYRNARERNNDAFKWGDEMEYSVVHFDEKEKRASVSLGAEKILAVLQEKYNDVETNSHQVSRGPDERWGSHWSPEYSRFSIESCPAKPYQGSLEHLATVEANMRFRIGCNDFIGPPECVPRPILSPASKSVYFPDCGITRHPRFPFLTRNIRERRGSKVEINIPIFKDTNTKCPFVEVFQDLESNTAAMPDHVYMDAMGFGMAQACLQCTVQAKDLNQAKLIYDQLVPWCPIMCALSAASPFYKGYITDIDTRWNVISASVDDRTVAERSSILQSRFGHVQLYLSGQYLYLNDVDTKINEDAKNTLLEAGVEEGLANHIAHLWIRDPLNLYSGRINIEDATDADHFENIQSTCWQTLRFKPPPPGKDVGWRVEFRPMDGQLTDFESAAYVVFVVLLIKVTLAKKLDFTIPMSHVLRDMDKAQKNNAVLTELFCFNTNFRNNEGNVQKKIAEFGSLRIGRSDDDCNGMTIDHIINGKGEFTGVISLLREYLDETGIEKEARNVIERYFELISKRACGECLTSAQWKRHFVRTHPDYKQDSVVSQLIEYDLLRTCDKIEKGETQEKLLYSNILPSINLYPPQR